MSAIAPFSLRIFVADGDPDGLRVVERSNWMGEALMFPRTLLPHVKERDELSQTGVYLLLGPRRETRSSIACLADRPMSTLISSIGPARFDFRGEPLPACRPVVLRGQRLFSADDRVDGNPMALGAIVVAGFFELRGNTLHILFWRIENADHACLTVYCFVCIFAFRKTRN